MINIEEIRKNPKAQNWVNISVNEILTEDFIREFKDYVDWNNIFAYQKLSKEFIIEFADKINFRCLLKNERINDDVKEFCKVFI